jgi:hypothetical protein
MRAVFIFLAVVLAVAWLALQFPILLVILIPVFLLIVFLGGIVEKLGL